MTIEQKRKEAVRRLQMTGMIDNVVKDFIDGMINKSESCGLLYWVEGELLEAVREFEAVHKVVVYHVICQQTNIGELINLLYVGNCYEEWEEDREMIRNGATLAYVINKNMPECSEFGTIGIATANGGLVRIW